MTNFFSQITYITFKYIKLNKNYLTSVSIACVEDRELTIFIIYKNLQFTVDIQKII